jgi:molecular chaperone GrpE
VNHGKHQPGSDPEVARVRATEESGPRGGAQPQTRPESAEFDAGELEAELSDARRRAEEYLNDLRRVAADFDNYRKRVARESEAQASRAAESLVGELLPVLDNLERALDATEHHEEAKVAEGVHMVKQQLAGLLARRGLEEIPCEPGDEFDPHVHEALSHQPSDQPEGAVAAVWQRGYRLGDRVVRAAKVVVSSGPPADEDA